MKKCINCNRLLPINLYYTHPQMSDGHLNKCIDCCRKQSKERENNLRKNKEWLEAERERGRRKYHRLYKNIKKKTSNVSQINFRKKYPEKIKATSFIKRKRPKGIHFHHWSYSKEHYGDILELNIEDHNLLHRHIYYDQYFFKYRSKYNIGKYKQGDLLSKEDHLQILNLIK